MGASRKTYSRCLKTLWWYVSKTISPCIFTIYYHQFITYCFSEDKVPEKLFCILIRDLQVGKYSFSVINKSHTHTHGNIVILNVISGRKTSHNKMFFCPGHTIQGSMTCYGLTGLSTELYLGSGHSKVNKYKENRQREKAHRVKFRRN